MSIATEIQRLQTAKAGIKSAIEAKGVTVGSSLTLDDYPQKIAEIPTGSSVQEAEENDVNFYDYDGFRVASYSKSDFANLTELPANPTHAGLTAQGWNWALADAKTVVAQQGMLDIGQMYVTDDGKTRLYITLASMERLTLPLYFRQSVSEGVEVDWGDGSAVETIVGSDKVNTTHTYANIGDYVVTLNPLNNCTLELGDDSNTNGVVGAAATTNQHILSSLTKAEIGRNVINLGKSAFYYCRKISTISLPNTITTFGNNCFTACSGLSFICLPNSMTTLSANSIRECYKINISIGNVVSFSIGLATFQGDYSLTRLIIPEVATLNGNLLMYCYSLTVIYIPNTVTSIGNYAFFNMSSMRAFHFLGNNPPTLGTNNFTNLPSDCRIYVPRSENQTVLNAYKTETNWLAFASIIEEEPLT